MLTPANQTEKQATKATQMNDSFFGSGGSAPFFQAKLTVNQPGDQYEQEADAVADQVMRIKEDEKPIVQRILLTPVSGVQRKCAECEQEEQEQVQRKETANNDSGGKSAPSIVSDVISSGGGQPMDGGTKQFMESRFGQDFGQVRIHTDSRAAESAAAIQARAYTSGRDVVFGAGEYQPGSESGKRLLAHELVHVGQQLSNAVQRVAAHESPALEDVQYEEAQNNSQTPGVQRTQALNQSTRTNHDPRIVYPWISPPPGGYNYFITTDRGTPITVWVALDNNENMRYWCHGHSLGTYRRWLYSVYSGSDMENVIRDEYRYVLPADVQSGDIAVWPTFGHSAIVQTVVKNNGVIDEIRTIMSTKNGRAPATIMSLEQVKIVYASSLGTNVDYYRRI